MRITLFYTDVVDGDGYWWIRKREPVKPLVASRAFFAVRDAHLWRDELKDAAIQKGHKALAKA